MKRYILGPLLIDSQQRTIMRGEERIHLAHKPTGILLLLLENAGTVVARDTLRETFWGETYLEEAAISRNISLIRTVLRLHLNGLDPIQTISKSGYCFDSRHITKQNEAARHPIPHQSRKP